MKAGEKARFHNEIYEESIGPATLTTEDILRGCEKTDALFSESLIAKIIKSPFYFDNQEDIQQSY